MASLRGKFLKDAGGVAGNGEISVWQVYADNEPTRAITQAVLTVTEC